MTAFFLRGLVIGFSIAAPVGPIGLLCIRRTLADGRAAGLVTGLGAATADAVYGAIAGFGLTAVSAFLVREQLWLRAAGGLFLIYLGIRAFTRAPAELHPQDLPPRSLGGAYATTLALTLTNPMTIVSFAAVFAGLGVVAARDYATAGALVVGVFTGSALWWLILSGAAATVRSRLGSDTLRWVNRAAGVIIAGFGAAALLSLR
ncbi:MAG TPA: LysE family translocator [bacterium]|nr:LysE family translocator [bacterium]